MEHRSMFDEKQLKAARNHLKVFAQGTGPKFQKAFDACAPYTMTSIERLYNLYQAVGYVTDKGIEGDIVECGVWQGGTMMMAAYALQDKGVKDRRLVLLDTFEGHPRPDGNVDTDVWGRNQEEVWKEYQTSEKSSDWARVSLETVQHNMRTTNYLEENIVYLKGMVEDTLPTPEIKSVSILRLDTDWYKSTRHILETLYSKVSYGGVIIVDDYGHLEGAKKAVDEYFSTVSDNIFFMHVDYSCVVAVKCRA